MCADSNHKKSVSPLFKGIIDQMEVIELTEEDLNLPTSLNEDNEIAALKDLMAQEAPVNVKAAFHMESAEAPKSRVKSVNDLKDEDLTKLTVNVIENSDPGETLSVVGVGEFNREELIRQVNEGTDLGRRMIQAVRLNAQFLENAMKAGKVKQKEAAKKVTLPEFDF